MAGNRWKGHGDEWPAGHRPCVVCHQMKAFDAFHKHAACKFGVNTVCKVCRVGSSRAYYRGRSKAQLLWERAKTRARARGLDFDIEVADIEIPDRCPVLGTPMERPSLDRHDPSKGYVRGNIVVMSTRANVLKNDGTLDEFRKLVAYLEVCEVVDIVR